MSVSVTEPIGEVPVKLEADEWEGLWKLYGDEDSGFCLIDIVDVEGGVLRLRDIGSEPEPPLTVILRKSGNWVFASVLLGDPPDTPRYHLGRVDWSNDIIVFWLANGYRLKDLVEAGRLPGIIQSGDVLLTELQPEHLKLITSGAEGVLFEWDSPMILTRVSKRY
jgi:hypothetical protein